MGASWSCGDRQSILPRAGSGAYRVGCADLMLRDGADGDSGIFMRVYYPVDHEEKDASILPPVSSHPLWLPRSEYLDGLAGYIKQSTTRLHFFSNWIMGVKRSPATWHSPLSGSFPSSSSLSNSTSLPEFSSPTSPLPTSRSFSNNQTSFPVVVFSHGLAGCRHFYSTYCASLASYGYVVAAVEHRDYSACWTYKLIPDVLSGRMKERAITMRLLDSDDKEFKIRNQQLGKRVSECVKALHVLEEMNLGTVKTQDIVDGDDFDWSQFKSRLNMSRTAVIGHSFGGATALASTAFSTDFQAVVVLDGWLFPLEPDHYTRAAQPTLFINSGKWQWKQNLERQKKFSNEAERIMYTHRDAVHQSFSDFPFLCSPFFSRRLNLQGDLPPIQILESNLELSVSFLRRVHEGETASATLSDIVKQKYSAEIYEGPSIDLNSAPVSSL